MYRVPGAGASWGLRWGVLTLAGIVTLLTVTTEPAGARGRRYRYYVKRYVQTESFSPRYAAIVLDAKTGAPLHEANPDMPLHKLESCASALSMAMRSRWQAGSSMSVRWTMTAGGRTLAPCSRRRMSTASRAAIPAFPR